MEFKKYLLEKAIDSWQGGWRETAFDYKNKMYTIQVSSELAMVKDGAGGLVALFFTERKRNEFKRNATIGKFNKNLQN